MSWLEYAAQIAPDGHHSGIFTHITMDHCRVKSPPCYETPPRCQGVQMRGSSMCTLMTLESSLLREGQGPGKEETSSLRTEPESRWRW